MPGDYPDWTDLIHLVGTDIMLAIDVQGAYIMMPVDIQGQIGELNINITASEVLITIDIEAQSVGIWLKADWSALQADDKTFNFSVEDVAWHENPFQTYGVPHGATLYITDFDFAC
ncbi:unnamed protein product, partial [marine sediment metagenome]